MSRKNLLACILTTSLLALAAPLSAQTTQPAATRPVLLPATTQPVATAPEATSEGGKGDPNKDTGKGGGMGGMWPFLLIGGMLVLMLIMSSRTRRKQQKQHQNMLSSMKKGDRVTTIGGLIGTLIEVRENEVVIKVDEQNNTRMRFLRSAVHHVGDAASAVAAEKEKGK